MTQPISISAPAQREGRAEDLPSPDIVAFIRYCHSQHGASWPELYDEMCGVAARREYHGWDHAQLAALGLTFSLLEMPRLAGWARAVVAAMSEHDAERDRASAGSRHRAKTAVA